MIEEQTTPEGPARIQRRKSKSMVCHQPPKSKTNKTISRSKLGGQRSPWTVAVNTRITEYAHHRIPFFFSKQRLMISGNFIWYHGDPCSVGGVEKVKGIKFLLIFWSSGKIWTSKELTVPFWAHDYNSQTWIQGILEDSLKIHHILWHAVTHLTFQQQTQGDINEHSWDWPHPA